QFKIFDHSPGNSISEGLTGADYIYTIMEFFTDHRFDTGGTDIKGDIIMFLQLVCLLASFFSLLQIQFTLYLIYCELFRDNSPVKNGRGITPPRPRNRIILLSHYQENRSHFLYIAPGPAFHRCPVLYSPPPHCRKAGNCCLSPDRLPPLCCRRSLRACRCNSSSCCLLSGSPPQFPARRS